MRTETPTRTAYIETNEGEGEENEQAREGWNADTESWQEKMASALVRTGDTANPRKTMTTRWSEFRNASRPTRERTARGAMVCDRWMRSGRYGGVEKVDVDECWTWGWNDGGGGD